MNMKVHVRSKNETSKTKSSPTKICVRRAIDEVTKGANLLLHDIIHVQQVKSPKQPTHLWLGILHANKV